MKRLLIPLVILFAGSTFAQQYPLYSQYVMNSFLVNPAIAGSDENTPIRLTARQMWAGIDQAPQTVALSGHTSLLGQQMGVGGFIYTDRFGPIGRTGIMGSYAYHFNLAKIDSRLALGLSLSAFQYKVNGSELILYDDYDSSIPGAVETAFVPDACFGAYLYRSNYYVGLAATQLFEFKVGINSSNENKMIRHYYLTGGYIFALSEKLEMEPSVLIKSTEKTLPQLDINLKAVLLKNYWMAFSYRNPDMLVSIIGVKYRNIYIGYAFDYMFGEISNYSTGSHELMLGINIGEKEGRGSTLF